MTSRDIGLRVTRLRETRNLSTTGLARKVGISQAQISRLENGKQNFRSPVLLKIAEALDLPVFYLVMTDDEWETYQLGLAARGRARLDVPTFGPGQGAAADA